MKLVTKNFLSSNFFQTERFFQNFTFVLNLTFFRFFLFVNGKTTNFGFRFFVFLFGSIGQQRVFNTFEFDTICGAYF